MNEDLLISIGADITSFTAATQKMKKQYDTIAKNLLNKPLQLKFKEQGGSFVKQMANIEKEAKETSKIVKAEMEKMLNFKRSRNVKTGQMVLSKEDEATLDRYFKEYTNHISKIEKKNEALTKANEAARIASEQRITKANHDARLAFWRNEQLKMKQVAAKQEALTKNLAAKKQLIYDQETVRQLNAQKTLALKQEAIDKRASAKRKLIIDQDVARALAAQKRLALAETRSIKSAANARLQLTKKIMAKREELSKAEFNREMARIRKLSNAQAKKEVRAPKASGDSSSKWGNIESITHAAKTTALYGAMGQALFGLQNAYRAVGAEIIRFDQSLYTNMAVLGTSYEDSMKLAHGVENLASTYGTSSDEIQGAMITLGRAGVDGTQQLGEATKVLTELAMITGDSMSDGAAGLSTMLSVYPELREEVTLLGDQMAIVANATRLGLKDFTTISNYALTTAASIGIQSDAYLALAGAMSKVGLNASTIGTSIRRLKKFTDSSSEAMVTFFRYMGASQGDFRAMLNNTETSTEALVTFSRKLAVLSKDKEAYTRATAKLNIQEKSTADVLAQIGKNEYLSVMLSKVKAVTAETKELENQARQMAVGLEKGFARVGSLIKQTFNESFLSVMETMFGDATRDAEKFTDMINTVTKTILVLMQQIPIVVAGFTAWIIKQKLLNVGIATTNSLLVGMWSGLKKMGGALLAFARANPIIAGLTIAATLFNAALVYQKELLSDVNDLIEAGIVPSEKYTKAQLELADDAVVENIQSITKSIKDLNDQMTGANDPDSMGGLSGKALAKATVMVEKLNKKLVEQNRILKGIRETELGIFKNGKSEYQYSAKEVAMQDRILSLKSKSGVLVSKSVLQYQKLVAKASEMATLAKSQAEEVDNEKETLKANLKLAEAEYALELKLKDIKEGLAKSEASLARAKLKAEKAQNHTLDIEGELKLIAEERDAIQVRLNAKALEKMGYDKNSKEYAIAQKEQNEVLVELYGNSATKTSIIETNLQNGLSILRQMGAAARTLATELGKTAAAMANMKIDKMVIDGTIDEFEAVSLKTNVKIGQVKIAVKNIDSQMLEISTGMAKVEETRRLTAEEISAGSSKALILLEQRKQLEIKIQDIGNKSVLNEREKAKELRKIGVQLEVNAAKQQSGGKRFTYTSEYTTESKKLAKEIAEIKERGAKANLDAAVTKKEIVEAEKAYNDLISERILKEQKLAQDGAKTLSKKKKTTNAAKKAARKADKAAKDAIKNALLLGKIEYQKAKNAMLLKGRGLTPQAEYTWKVKLLKIEKRIAKEAIATAQALANGPKSEKLVLEAKLKLLEVQGDINKLTQENQDQWIEVGQSIADALGNGLGDAFKSIIDFYDKVQKAGDAFRAYEEAKSAAKLATDATGAMVKAGQQGGYYGMAVMAAILAGLGVAQSIAGMGDGGQAKLDAAKLTATDNATVNSETMEDSLNMLTEIGTLGLAYSSKMVTSLQLIADQSLLSAKNMSPEITGANFKESSTKGFWNDSETSLLESGIALDSATIDQINAGQMTASQYQVTATENSGWLGIGSGVDIDRTDGAAVDQSVLEPLNNAYREGMEVLRTSTEALGVSATEFDQASASWITSAQDLNFAGLDAQERAQLIQGAVAGDIDEWASSIESLQPLIEKYKIAGEGAGATVIRVTTTYEVGAKAMRDMGATLPPLTENGYELADAMIKASGGIDKFTKSQKKWNDQFMTEQQKNAINTRDLTISAKAMGIVLPTTNQGMLDLHNQLTILSATSPEAARQLKWLDDNIDSLAMHAEQASAKIGSAAGSMSSCGAAASSCSSATSDMAQSAEDAAEAAKQAALDFEALQRSILDLKAEWSDNTVKSAQAMLDLVVKQTGLNGINYDNFLKKFTAVAGSLKTAEDLTPWQDLSSALQNLQSAVDEQTQAEVDIANQELSFYEDLLRTIQDAWLGTLSYLSKEEKAVYAGQQAEEAINDGDSATYFEMLSKQLEYEKSMSRTKEDYIPLFDAYMKDVSEAEFEPDKNTDDVVETLEEISAKIEGLQDAIEKASYQGA